MNDLQVFQFESNELRTVQMNGETWFVAADVCFILDINNPSDAVKRLDMDERALVPIEGTNNGNRPLNCVNESGLYSLILGSRKSEARTFKRWVTHDVIPAIRKTGSYSLTQPQSVEDLIILQAQSMKEMRQQLNDVATQLQTHQHRIDSLDRIDVDGDAQQRLNKMIRRYAHQEGVTFQKAWRDFTDRFNTAYHTNLTARVENYREKHGLKELTRPQYLSIANELEDAIRVADKMLNQEAVEV